MCIVAMHIHLSSRLCHDFKTGASGFVRIKNIVDQSVSEKHLYQITRNSAEKCFRFKAGKSIEAVHFVLWDILSS